MHVKSPQEGRSNNEHDSTGSVLEYMPTVNEEPRNPFAKVAGIPILSFFTGAGFLDMGFLKAGFNIIWHNEYDPYFIRGFEYGMFALLGSTTCSNIQNTHSILDIGPNQIAKEAFHNTPRPAVFGIIGGPPCPDFSVGGKNRGQEGDRGKLSQVYTHRIIELQPSFFLFENVPGLLRTSKHRQFLADLMKQLSRDYLIDLKVLNALEYGAPQDRERVFLVGFLKKWLRKNIDLDFPVEHDNWFHVLSSLEKGSQPVLFPAWDSWFPWHVDPRYTGAKSRFNWPKQSPFGGDPEKPAGIPDELMVGPLLENWEELASLPNGKEGFDPKSGKFTSIPEGDVSRKSFKRLHRWRYSPAVAYGNNEVHLHPTQPRRLTVREALRIQTVPDDYTFPPELPLSHKFKMIGNGVPVKLARTIANSFVTVLGGNLNGNGNF